MGFFDIDGFFRHIAAVEGLQFPPVLRLFWYEGEKVMLVTDLEFESRRELRYQAKVFR
jgi:hypothetical protein